MEKRLRPNLSARAGIVALVRVLAVLREMILLEAYVLHGVGDLRREARPLPVPPPGEALVEVKAVGICGSDIPRIYETGAHRHPLIPGHEFSGVVIDTGDAADRGWIGRRVGVFPLIPCRRCQKCKEQKYEMCEAYDYIGSRRDGAFAECVSVPVENLVPLPDYTSFEEGAMLEPMAVAVHAMRRVASVSPGTALVMGLGTIGRLLAMFLMEAGAWRLLLVGNKDGQRDFAISLGVPECDFFDSRSGSSVVRWVMERTGGLLADAVFECVGRGGMASLAIDCAAAEGYVVLVGNPASDMTVSKNTYWKILRRQLIVTGTWNSSFTSDASDDWHYVVERLKTGRVSPARIISHRLAFDDLARGLSMMRDRTEEFCKVMILM